MQLYCIVSLIVNTAQVDFIFSVVYDMYDIYTVSFSHRVAQFVNKPQVDSIHFIVCFINANVQLHLYCIIAHRVAQFVNLSLYYAVTSILYHFHTELYSL